MKNEVIVIHTKVGIFNELGQFQTSMDQTKILQSNRVKVVFEKNHLQPLYCYQKMTASFP
jgi:hypothetical protein